MNQAEFSRRVLAIEGKLYRVSLCILGREADARDATREALCRAWLCQNALKDASQFESWLLGLLVDECRRMLRRRKAFPCAPAPEGEGVDLAVREALFSLEEKLRLPLVLSQVEGYQVEEIAQILKARTAKVESWLRQGTVKLHDLLGERGEDA